MHKITQIYQHSLVKQFQKNIECNAYPFDQLPCSNVMITKQRNVTSPEQAIPFTIIYQRFLEGAW